MSSTVDVIDDLLHDSWTVYFHDPDNTNWTLQSYDRIADISSIDDFWGIHIPLLPIVVHGMFFVMRENVFPCWDDAANINGGCISMKVAMELVPDVWDELLKRMLGETITLSSTPSISVNGMSVSPKRGFCVVKIWLGENVLTVENVRSHIRIPDMYTGELVYRRNLENIQMDSVKLPAAAGRSALPASS
jgi:hypothetical protein